jgi:REP element-mobilizing transposase RayT
MINLNVGPTPMSSDPPNGPESRPRSRPPGGIGLRRLIEAKRAGGPTIDPVMIRRGFRGWHERGYLPHYDAPHVTQIVTFMLVDSFPVDRRREWEPILSEEHESLRRRKLEAWLDRGMGECWPRQPSVATLVEKTLSQFDGIQYRLQAWVLMPNHVHLVVDVRDTPLSQLVKRWKGGTARAANLLLGRHGTFWQGDYFDTKIRDAVHLAQAIRYVEQNPTKAKLVRNPREWPWSSARLRDDHNRLPWRREAASSV